VPKVRLAAVATTLVLSSVACGGGGSTPTGSGETAMTPASPSADPTEASSPPTVSPTPLELDDEAQACMDAFLAFLVDIEDLVAGFDFEHASLFDYRDFALAQEPSTRKLYTRVQGGRCVGAGGQPPETILPLIMDRAKREAPGSVPYLELLLAMSDLRTAGSCREDQRALLRYVRAGGTVSDVTVAERFHAYSLAASIDLTCGLRGAATFLGRGDVQRFLELD